MKIAWVVQVKLLGRARRHYAYGAAPRFGSDENDAHIFRNKADAEKCAEEWAGHWIGETAKAVARRVP